MDLCGNRLLQNDFIIPLCQIRPSAAVQRIYRIHSVSQDVLLDSIPLETGHFRILDRPLAI